MRNKKELVKIELSKGECDIVANALFCFMKENAKKVKTDKKFKNKKLSDVNGKAGELHRFFLSIGA